MSKNPHDINRNEHPFGMLPPKGYPMTRKPLNPRDNDFFFDRFDADFDKNFDKTFKRTAGAIIALWVVSALASLAVTVVVVWAIIQLVQWVTTK